MEKKLRFYTKKKYWQHHSMTNLWISSIYVDLDFSIFMQSICTHSGFSICFNPFPFLPLRNHADIEDNSHCETNIEWQNEKNQQRESIFHLKIIFPIRYTNLQCLVVFYLPSNLLVGDETNEKGSDFVYVSSENDWTWNKFKQSHWEKSVLTFLLRQFTPYFTFELDSMICVKL